MEIKTNTPPGSKPTVHLYDLRHWKGKRRAFAVIGEEAEHGDVDGFALFISSRLIREDAFAAEPRRVASLHAASGWFEVACGPVDAPGIERKTIILHGASLSTPGLAATVGQWDISMFHEQEIVRSHRTPTRSSSVSNVGRHAIPISLAAMEAGHDATASTSLAMSAEVILAIDPENPRWTEPGKSIYRFDDHLSSLGILTATVGLHDGQLKGPGAGIVRSMCHPKAMDAAAAWVLAAKDTPQIFWDMMSLFADASTLRQWDLQQPTGHRRMETIDAIERLKPFANAYLQALPSGHRTEDFLLGVSDHLNRCHDGQA